MPQSSETSPSAGTRSHGPPSSAADQALVQRVLQGSPEAWHELIRRYSRLLLAVIRRYVGHNEDDVRSVYADLLESLYRRKLATYEGRSALSTWLVLVARSEAVDHVRRCVGGRDLRKAIAGLEPFDQRVFQLYYLQGLGFGTALQLLKTEDASASAERFFDALQQIESCVHGRLARTLRYEIHAQSVGQASGRLLEYLDQVRAEMGGAQEEQSAEYQLMERETRAMVGHAMAVIAQLPQSERRVLSLRFEQGWTARRIAEELGIDGQRRVYTIIERILRALRLLLRPDSRPESSATSATWAEGDLGRLGPVSDRKEG